MSTRIPEYETIARPTVAGDDHPIAGTVAKTPVLIMGMGIDLYGKERRAIRMISEMKRLAPLFLLSQWDRGEVSRELTQRNLPWQKASFGYLGFARPRWTLINIALMPGLFYKVWRAARGHSARVLLFLEVLSFVNAFPAFLLLRALYGTRIAFYLGDIGGGTRVQRWILRLVDRMADVVVVNSDAVKEGLRQSGIRRTPIHVVHNGVTVDEFGSATAVDRSDLHWSNHNFVVGFVGQLTENKGISDFLEAARQAHQQRNDLRFLVVGQAPQNQQYADELKQQFRDLGDHVRFVGFVSDVARYYRTMNAVVVPSRHVDPAPNVNLEAMAAGLPVIATAIGGNPELIDDGTTGFLVPPRKPAAIAERLLQLAADRDQAQTMGAAGRDRCRLKFNSLVNASVVESLILGEHAVARTTA